MALYGNNQKNTSFFIPIKKADGLDRIVDEENKSKRIIKKRLMPIFRSFRRIDFNKKGEEYEKLIKKINYQFGTNLEHYKDAKSIKDLFDITYENQTHPSPLEIETIHEAEIAYNFLN